MIIGTVNEQNQMKNWSEILGNDWYNLLKDIIESTYFINLGKFIARERTKYKIYPDTTEDIFSVFRSTPLSKLKVVILGQDPYHDGSYDGLAFSNKSNKKRLSPSLINILKEVRRDIYKGMDIELNPDLHRWAEQGVLLINTALSVRAGMPNSHKNEWREFSEYLIKSIDNQDIIFMYWGKEAQYFSKFNILGTVIVSGHPSPLNTTNPFIGCGCFSDCNRELEARNKSKIIW